MRVTKKTKYATFQSVEKYIQADGVAELKKAAEHALGSMYDLTFSTFCDCLSGDFSHLGKMDDPTVLQVYWCKRFEDFATEFSEALKKLAVPQTADERQASEGLLQVTFAEATLCFLQQWFELHSYREAEQITLGEILIAKRAAYNDALYRRKLANIQLKRVNR